MGQVLFLALFVLKFSPQAGASFFPIHSPVDFAPEAIYGKDDRQLIDKTTSKKIQTLSQSIAMIVSEDVVTTKGSRSLINAKLLTDTDGVNLCTNEKFAVHHSVNSCTGFLVAPDLLVSAGHCFMSEEDCASKKIIFNVAAASETKDGYSIPNNTIYECKNIVKSSFDADNLTDYSMIRLKTKAAGRTPLKLRKSGSISTRDQVFMIGHPLGMPLVATNNAFVNDVSNAHFFKATLDSFEGNSGSPVFNSKTFEVEGILVRGEDDFVEDSKAQCYRNEVYDQGSAGTPAANGESVSRISEILPL
jgi:V8-like Glu-specific endopeptidase